MNGMRIDENRRLSGLTPFEYFSLIFTMHYLAKNVALKNVQLSFRGRSHTNGPEILKFLGTVVLMSRFQFGARRDLWISENKYKYVPAPKFGNIMAIGRFESLRACLSFSDCRLPGDEVNGDRWQLVDGFIKVISKHREMFSIPSDVIFVDEVCHVVMDLVEIG